MRWKYYWVSLGVLLLVSGVFVFLVWRAEWFFHVVARKDFPYPSDAPHPNRFTAEIRRRYPEHDWLSFFSKWRPAYMQYECLIRTETETLTSSFWVIADEPHPSTYSISVRNMDTHDGQVLFQIGEETRRCRFELGGHYCWVNDWDLSWEGNVKN